MKIEREKIVLFRTASNIMIAMTDDDLINPIGRTVRLFAPRVCAISQHPQTNQMNLTLIPYGIISAKTFLSELIDNTSYKVDFSIDSIECVIPKEDIGTTIINLYIGTLTSLVIPTALNDKLSPLNEGR